MKDAQGQGELVNSSPDWRGIFGTFEVDLSSKVNYENVTEVRSVFVLGDSILQPGKPFRFFKTKKIRDKGFRISRKYT